MSLDTHVMISSIDEHCAGLAHVAARGLDAPIEHCPGWTMEGLLGHLVEVHRFWSTVAEQGLAQRPDLEPVSLEQGEQLIEQFLRGARHLTDVLSGADQKRMVWTWAPGQQDIAFITRHQVQEIVVHHWDGAHALGMDIEIDPMVAIDAIEEFLTVSVSSDIDPAEPPRPALNGALALACTDIAKGWTIRDGSTPGTARFRDGLDADVPQLRASSSQLLLWLYSRTEIDADDEVSRLAERLRALAVTD
jgi:uncharacterized protein (TIGR03083 family)